MRAWSASESRNLLNQEEETFRQAVGYCCNVFLQSGRFGTGLPDVFIVLYVDLITKILNPFHRSACLWFVFYARCVMTSVVEGCDIYGFLYQLR